MSITNFVTYKGKTVLITGATGFTGSVLTKKLVMLGAKVRCIARKSSDISPFAGGQIEWFRGDVFDESIIREAVNGVNYIFHVAAAYREAKISDETYFNVHVKSTQLLAEYAQKLPNLKRFSHVSTVGVHSHIQNPPADENYPINPGDIYQKTKAEAELWIRKFSAENRLPLTVVRPAAIYGQGDKRLLKVFKMAQKRVFPILGNGKCLYHLIHVEDLTDFMLYAAIHQDTLGEVYICGNPEPVQLKKMVQIIADASDKTIKFFRFPATPFFVLGFLCEILCKPLGIEPPIYRRRVAFYTKDRAFDTRKMLSTGFKPKNTNEGGLTETAKWYFENCWL